MADPQARAAAALRGLKVAPPPRRTAVPPPATPTPVETPTEDEAAAAVSEPKATPRKRTTRKPVTERKAAAPAAAAAGEQPGELIGRSTGNKRSITVYLTVATRQALDDEAAATGDSRGVIIMRAMRDGYQTLAKQLATPDGGGVGPFPAERVTHRRRGDEPRLPTTAILWPDEVAAIQQVATELTSGNVSALVNDALQLRYP